MPSSVIFKYRYFPAEQVLQVTFVSGAVYNYKNVPGNIFQQFSEAKNKGRFLNEHIKPWFHFEKLLQ
ncbi:KTSC domain-containing protein [Polluticaenibacter yanchengensis]|uniref:KTSC domain-containing protein n=1 Tax=Polluticaenibacter yanchengensis TaxID=3014562 RepID=A0ABT4UFH3_9BACT|nr:KTSC domain-containing protein [Chitinophagaceae bacterium LY-5]